MGKYTKVTFHDKDSLVQAILERVHSDVCGPFLTSSMSKHMYYVAFVDDFSHKCWILFMHTKYQTFSNFFEFKVLVEKYTSMKIKSLRRDNSGEYVSNEFKKFCA